MAGKISPSCKWNGMFPFRSVATKKVEQLRRLSVCSGKFPLEPRVPFAFHPVEPEILAKWKAPLVSPPSSTPFCYCVFYLILFADKLYSISELFVSLCFESTRNTSCFLLTRSQPQFDLNTLRQKSDFCALSYGSCSFLNPLSPSGDQHQFSPNNIHTW